MKLWGTRNLSNLTVSPSSLGNTKCHFKNKYSLHATRSSIEHCFVFWHRSSEILTFALELREEERERFGAAELKSSCEMYVLSPDLHSVWFVCILLLSLCLFPFFYSFDDVYDSNSKAHTHKRPIHSRCYSGQANTLCSHLDRRKIQVHFYCTNDGTYLEASCLFMFVILALLLRRKINF